jgi:hypothetical protein
VATPSIWSTQSTSAGRRSDQGDPGGRFIVIGNHNTMVQMA